MSDATSARERFRRVFLLLLVAGISAAFLVTIERFVLALLLAAVFSGLCWPLKTWLLRALGGRNGAAAGLTIGLVLLGVVVPLIALTGVVTTQALQVSEAVKPWLAERAADARAGHGPLEGVVLPSALQPYEHQIVAKLGAAAGSAGSFVVEELAAATRGTVGFLFSLFVMLYAMFFFLRDGESILALLLSYVPLPGSDQERLLERFVSVTRATLRGSLVIGALQGVLAGLAFAVVGIQGAAFWGTVIALASLIPGVGTALVWVPAVIYLFATGERTAAVGLAVWCSVVVGTVDNLLRPRLVGRDTRMSDLLIFLATMGGLLTFGAAGVLIGPLVAALFVTVWDMYGLAFRDVLVSASGDPGQQPE